MVKKMNEDYLDNIKCNPEEFRIRGTKQNNLIILDLKNNSIVPQKLFYYSDISDLAKYNLFLEHLFCNDSVIIDKHYNIITKKQYDISIQQLKEKFSDYKKKTLENRIKDLYFVLHTDDNLDTTNLENKIKKLEAELDESKN